MNYLLIDTVTGNAVSDYADELGAWAGVHALRGSGADLDGLVLVASDSTGSPVGEPLDARLTPAPVCVAVSDSVQVLDYGVRWVLAGVAGQVNRYLPGVPAPIARATSAAAEHA